MAASKVGPMIKEARNKAGLSQQALADLIPGLSATDISKAERGEKNLEIDQLKAIAKATGVTQKSLVEAATGTAGKTTTSGKTTSSTSGRKTNTGSKTSSAKTNTTTSGKTTTASKPSSVETTSMKLTAAEKKLVEAYRKADADAQKQALKILKGTKEEVSADLLSSLLGSAMESLLKK